MKKKLALLVLAPIIAVVGLARAPSGAAAPSASSSASPPASAGAVAPAQVDPIKGSDIPTERSEPPQSKEWATARQVLTNNYAWERVWRSKDGLVNGCTLRLIREWLQVDCLDHYGAGLIAGERKDVTVQAYGDMFNWNEATQSMSHSHVTAVLPIERGKARIIGFDDGRGGDDFGYGPAMPGEAMTLHVWWRDGDADPSIEATGSWPSRR